MKLQIIHKCYTRIGMFLTGYFLITTSFAQIDDVDALNRNLTRNIVYTYDNRYEGVKGSPYLFEEWIPGRVNMFYESTGKSGAIKDVEIQLDIHNHWAFVSPLNSSQIIQLDDGIHTVTLFQESDTILYDLVDVGEGPQFSRQLTFSKPMLREVYLKIYRKADYRGLYSSGRTYDEFISRYHIYLQHKGDFIKVKPGLKFLDQTIPKL